MFSLIIAIVAIALTVAIVAATMYHGGDTLTQGRATADAAAFVSGAQQIVGAAKMYQALEGTAAGSIDDLTVKKYLSSVPSASDSWYMTSGSLKRVTAPVPSAEVCDAVNKGAGITNKPTDQDEILGRPYGCVADPVDPYWQFIYFL